MSDMPTNPPADAPPTASLRAELLVFGFIAAVLWPVMAVGVVGGYGFAIWMAQLILGPPGPPHQ